VNIPGIEEARKKILKNVLSLILLFVLASLFFGQFRLPFTPIWQGNDQWDVLSDSARMWQGETIYRDFYEQTTPGTAVVHLLSFRLFGLRNWIPNLHIILLGLGLAWLAVVMTRKVISEGPFLTLLPACLFLTFAFFPHLQDTHRWYSTLASMGALAVVMEDRALWRLAVAGGLSGIASFFTQTQGVFAIMALVTFMAWEWRAGKSTRLEFLKRTTWLFVAFVTIVLATDSYFVWKAGVGRFLDCVLVTPMTLLSSDRANNSWRVYMTELPQLPHWYNLPGWGRVFFIYALLPLAYILFLVHSGRDRTQRTEELRLALLNLMGLFMFASVAMAPSYFRMCTVSAPAFVTLIYCIRGRGKVRRKLAASLWVVVLYLGAAYPLRVQSSPAAFLHLPRGQMAFSHPESGEYKMLKWLSSHTRPGEFFFATGQAYFFFPLGLRPAEGAGAFDNTGATSPEDVRAAVVGLEKYAGRFIEWPPDSTDPSLYRPEEDHLAPLKEYVEKNYHRVTQFGSPGGTEGGEIWERNQ